MAMMVAEVYDALRSAGAEEGPARRAAEVMASDERLKELRADMTRQFAEVGQRFGKVDERLGKVDERLTRVESRLDMLFWVVGIGTTLTLSMITGTIFLLLRALPTAVGAR